MALLPARPLSKSGLYLASNLDDNLYSRVSRTIWTPDGEFRIPRKKRRVRRGLSGVVSDVWMKDERGKLVLYDPVGEKNTISEGALYDILQMMMGYWSNSSNIAFGSELGSSAGPGQYGPWYSDGTYNFPNLNDLFSAYNGTDTYYADASLTQLAWSLFGNLWFLNGTSAGMTGSHIPSATIGSGFVSAVTENEYSFNNGWFTASPTQPSSPNTTMSDSVSNATSGTPQIQHTLTLSLSSSGTSFTFDGICWHPQNAYIRAYFGTDYNEGSYYVAGNIPTTFGGAYGSYATESLAWGSASTSPSQISDLMVAALWVPGYGVTINPGGSWGFTYSFLM